MGIGITVVCQKCRCRRDFLFGVGFVYPGPMLLKGRKGVDDVLEFAEKYPEGRVVYDRVIKRCRNCGNLSGGMDLSMYLPNFPDRNHSILTAVPGNRISPGEARRGNYRKYKDHEFTCQRCGHREMESFDEDSFHEAVKAGEIYCPDCGLPLDPDTLRNRFMWD